MAGRRTARVLSTLMTGLDDVIDAPDLPSIVDTEDAQRQRRIAAQQIGADTIPTAALIADYFPNTPPRNSPAIHPTSSSSTRTSPRNITRQSTACQVCSFKINFFFFIFYSIFFYLFELIFFLNIFLCYFNNNNRLQ